MTCTTKNIIFSVPKRNWNVSYEMKNYLIQCQNYSSVQLYGRQDAPSIVVDNLECQYYINRKISQKSFYRCLFETHMI